MMVVWKLGEGITHSHSRNGSRVTDNHNKVPTNPTNSELTYSKTLQHLASSDVRAEDFSLISRCNRISSMFSDRVAF